MLKTLTLWKSFACISVDDARVVNIFYESAADYYL